jgi:hypothetical protein
MRKNNNLFPYEAINDIKAEFRKWIDQEKGKQKFYAFVRTNNLSNFAITGWLWSKSTRSEVMSSADQVNKSNDEYDSR